MTSPVPSISAGGEPNSGGFPWKGLFEALGALAAIAGIWFGALQYSAAQKWKKTELAAQELDKLRSDELLVISLLMLDWHTRVIRVPDAYVDPVTSRTLLMHNVQTMNRALGRALGEESGATVDLETVVYIDALDRLFMYLEQVNHYLDVSLVRERDVSSLAYWLQRIELTTRDSPLLARYLDEFNFEGVRELANRLREYMETPA